MHQALYRKYRPAAFSDVVGQTHITSVLRYQVKEGRTSHAYLFCGSRGTGKTTCAKILAKAVNCLDPVNGDPCGKCENCLAIENGSASDVTEMDAASNTGVDYIRDIKDEVMYAPSMLKNRIYIIDEVHMLSPGAFNALLKTLEEPPSHVVFILATTEMQKIPATILSRCQRFEFKRISADVISARLSYIAKNEAIELEDDAARLIARAAQGGMRDAISLLELCSADGGKVTTKRVEELSGGVGRKTSEDAVRAIADRSGRAIFDIVASIYASTGDLSVFISELIGYYRDMTVYKTVKDMPEQELRREILDLTEGEFEVLRELSDRFRYETLLYHSSILEKALPQIVGSVGMSGRIAAELALLRLTVPKLDATPEALLDRISKLEEALLYAKAPACGVSAKPDLPARETPPSEPVRNPAGPSVCEQKDPAEQSVKQKSGPAPDGAPETPRTRKVIGNFVDVIRAYEATSPSSSAWLSGAAAYDLGDGTVEVVLRNALSLQMLKRERAEEALAAIIYSECSINARVVFTVAPDDKPKTKNLFDLD